MTFTQICESVREQLPTLVERIVSGVWEVVPGYDLDHITLTDFETYVADNVGVVLRLIGGERPPTAQERRFSEELGHHRALQGVPIDGVIRSFRTAERIIQDAFVDHITELDKEDARRCLAAVTAAIDHLSQAALDAYHRTQQEITIQYERLETDLVARLAGGERLNPERFAEEARSIGVEPERPYQVVALAIAGRRGVAVLNRVQRHLLGLVARRTRARILMGSWEERALLVVPVASIESGVDPDIIKGMDDESLPEGSLAGVGSVAGSLVEASTSSSQALAALQIGLIRGTSRAALLYHDVILETMVLSNQTAGHRLVESLLGPLLDHSELLKTVRAYIDNGMGLRRTARALVVHPNTVVYRLNRIEQLTGRSIRHSSAITDFALALRTMTVLPIRAAPEGASGARDQLAAGFHPG